MPVYSDMKMRTKCGTWVADQIVNSSGAGRGSTTTERGSIALGISRWLM